MSEPRPTRSSSDLASTVETLLDKGVVINADIAVSIGDTELLGIQLRAALASFETAAEYGLEFPSGTDMQRVAAASGREPLEEGETEGDGAVDTHSSTPEAILSERPDGSESEGTDETDADDTEETDDETDAEKTEEESSEEQTAEATPDS